MHEPAPVPCLLQGGEDDIDALLASFKLRDEAHSGHGVEVKEDCAAPSPRVYASFTPIPSQAGRAAGVLCVRGRGPLVWGQNWGRTGRLIAVPLPRLAGRLQKENEVLLYGGEWYDDDKDKKDGEEEDEEDNEDKIGQ